LASAANNLAPPLWVFDPPGVQPFDAAWADYRVLASLGGILLIAFLLIGGVLGDRHGRRRLWLIGLSGFIVSNLLIMVSPAPPWHLPLRFCVLAFGSLFMPLVLATLHLTFYERRPRSIAFSLYTAVNAGAMQIAWVQGQFLNEWFGWRAAYVLPMLFAVFAMRWVSRDVPETRSDGQRRPELLMASGWTLLILAMIYGLMVLPIASDFWWLVVGSTVLVGVSGASLVIFWSKQTSRELLRRRTFRARDLTALIITGAVINFTLIGFGLRTLGLFQVVRSLPAIVAVIALAPMLLGLLAAVYLFLQTMRQYQARAVIAGGLVVMAVAMAIAALVPATGPYLLFVVPLVIFGMGYLVASTVWTSAFLRSAVAGHYGINAAISSATSVIGGAVGSAVTGSILANLGLELYFEKLTAANVNPLEALEALVGFKTLVLSEPTDVAAVTDALRFDLLAGYHDVYAIAFSQVLWLMVALCLVTALIIGFGLRGTLKATTHFPTEEELNAAA